MHTLKYIIILILTVLLTGCLIFGKVKTGVDGLGHFESPHLKKD